jgi:hypothetical protein
MVLRPIGFFHCEPWGSINVPFLSDERPLGFTEDNGPYYVNIAGWQAPIYRSPLNSHFLEVNLLGMDFFHHFNVSQLNDFRKRRSKLLFGIEWLKKLKL